MGLAKGGSLENAVVVKDDKIITVVEPKQDLLASYEQSVSKIIQGPGLIT